MDKKKVLITGAAGFIGSNMAAYQLAKGNQVWGVDNLATGRLSNVEPLEVNSLWRFDQSDVQSWPKLAEAVKWADWIFHMAGSVGQKYVLKNPTITLANNIDGFEAVVKAATAVKSKARILISSTSELYINSREDSDGKVRETAAISFTTGNFLQETYPVGKLVNEVMALSYVHEKGLDCVIARLFNTIGLNQSGAYGMVVPTFIEQATHQKPLTVYGDGLQSRSFSDVRDTVAMLDLLLMTPLSKGEVVNVGNDVECSIVDLAKLIIKMTNSSSQISYMSYKDAYGVDFVDVRRRQPNLSKLRKLTEFSPQFSLEQTIETLIQKNRR